MHSAPGLEESGEEGRRRGEKEKGGGERKKERGEKRRRGKGKEKRRKRKGREGKKKEGIYDLPTGRPAAAAGSMPSAHGGSTTFLEGPSGRIQKKLGCSHVSDGQKGAPPENGFRFLALANKSKGRKFSSEI